MAKSIDFDAEGLSQPLGIKKSPETVKLEQVTESMVERSRAWNRRWHRFWLDGLNYVFNNQLAGKRRKDGWPYVQMNVLFPGVKQFLAHVAHSRMQIEPQPVKPEEPQSEEASQFWKGLLAYRQRKTLKMHLLRRRAALDGQCFGVYAAKVYPDLKARWDKDTHSWRYEPRVRLLHPTEWGMDPDATDADDAQYMWCEYLIPVEKALADWGITKERRDLIEAVAQMPQTTADPEIAGLGTNSMAPSGMADADTERGEKIDDSSAKRDAELVDLIEFARRSLADVSDSSGPEVKDHRGRYLRATEIYFRDGSTRDNNDVEDIRREELLAAGAVFLEETKVKVRDPNHPLLKSLEGKVEAGQPLNVGLWPTREINNWKDEPEFPDGRFVIKLNGSILNTKAEDQRWQYPKWPIVSGVNHLLPHCAYGLNGSEMVRGTQDWINISMTHMLNWLCYFGDPIWKVGPKAFPKGTRKRGGNPIKAVAGFIMRVANMNAVVREDPPQLPAGALQIFELMMNQGQDLAGSHDPSIGAPSGGSKTAYEIGTLQQQTQLGMGLAMVHLDEWTAAILEIVAEYDRRHLERGVAVRLLGEELGSRSAEFTDELADLEMDLEFVPSDILPHSKELKRADASKVLEVVGPAYLPEFLESYDVPNKQKVLQRHQEYQEFLAWKAEQQAIAEQQAREQAKAAPAAPAATPGPGIPPAPQIQGAG